MWLLAVTGPLVGVSVLNSLYLQNAAGASPVRTGLMTTAHEIGAGIGAAAFPAVAAATTGFAAGAKVAVH